MCPSSVVDKYWSELVGIAEELSQNGTQVVWFAESKPESFLQPGHKIPGNNVATEHPGDLWEPYNQQRRPEVGATCTKIDLNAAMSERELTFLLTKVTLFKT